MMRRKFAQIDETTVIDVTKDFEDGVKSAIDQLEAPIKKYLSYEVGGQANIDKIAKDLLGKLLKVAMDTCENYLEEKDLM